MRKLNLEKTISANSRGIVIYYGDAKKHQFVEYGNICENNISFKPTKKYQNVKQREYYQFSDKQKDIFYKAINGFKAYTKEEIDRMSEKKKLFITVRYTKVQRILRNWKQDVTFTQLDDMLLAIFPKSSIVKQLVSTKGHVDIDKKDEISFYDLGISKKQVADRLVEYGFLPENFYQLI